MLGHTPQCSGVSTQVLAECTPALAGEGRKNQSLLVPNVLERAEERRSTLEGVSESRTGRGETEASGSPHRLAKGKQRSTPAWTWVSSRCRFPTIFFVLERIQEYFCSGRQLHHFPLLQSAWPLCVSRDLEKAAPRRPVTR